jgi:hypothetical protein
MSIYCHVSLPDIRDIMLRCDYDRFPSFIDVDTRLEWIERFAPYQDSRLYIRNQFDELIDIEKSIAKSIYRKLEQLLSLLQKHKEAELLRIKEEYDELYMAYLEEENREFGFKTLSQLLTEYQFDIQYPFVDEITLYEKQFNLVMILYRKKLCVIKRTFLEIFWDERDEANSSYIVPISELSLQEIIDIPIDLQTIGLSPEDIFAEISSTFGTAVYKTLSSQSESDSPTELPDERTTPPSPVSSEEHTSCNKTIA